MGSKTTKQNSVQMAVSGYSCNYVSTSAGLIVPSALTLYSFTWHNGLSRAVREECRPPVIDVNGYVNSYDQIKLTHFTKTEDKMGIV